MKKEIKKMITLEDWEVWEKKFPDKYLKVMRKKCQKINCGNYRLNDNNYCISCAYGKSKKLSPEDMAVVRKMLGVPLTDDEKNYIKKFDNQIVHKQKPCGLVGDRLCGDTTKEHQTTVFEKDITCPKCKKLMKEKKIKIKS
jgi:hypothetical protein